MSGIEAFDQRFAQAIEAFEHPVSFRRLRGVEQHPAQMAIEAGGAPMIVSALFEQRGDLGSRPVGA